jgi:hypothetical protein
MSTNSHIGKQLENGSIKYIYCHWNGKPSDNGQILKEHYTDEAKVDALLELGSLSILNEEIGEQQNFNNRDTHHEKWCLAYGRDRGDKNTKAKIAKSLSDILHHNYYYVWVNGEWHCYDNKGQEMKL